MSFLPLDFTLANLNDGSDNEMDVLHSPMEGDIPTFSQDSDPDSFLSSHDDDLSKSPLFQEESLDFIDGGIALSHCPLDAIDPSPQRAPFMNITHTNKLNRDVHVPMTPITPTKPGDFLNDPLTPTANLKVLISAASPEIRNRDNKKKELFLKGLMKNDDTACEVKDLDCWQENLPGNGVYDAELGGRRCEPPASRKEKSLGLLCMKFLDMFPEYTQPDVLIELCLDEVAKELAVGRRRIYDIVNVLESVDVVSRIAKNKYAWHGKANLPSTLARLKALGESEGYAKKIQNIKDIDYANEMNEFEPKGKRRKKKTLAAPNPPSQPDDVFTSMALMQAKAMLRKDKSLGIMSQKFLMLFLVSDPMVVNLDLAAKILIGDPNIDKSESAKYKTKIRRLYDIANILTSLHLIQKVHVTELRGRKPAFKYIGPSVDVPQGQLGFPVDALYLNKRLSMVESTCNAGTVLPNPSAEAKFAAEILIKTESRIDALKQEARPSGTKKPFSRHASFDLICQAAEKERTKLYSSLPPSPVTVKFENISQEPPPQKKPPIYHTIMPPATEKKSTTFLVIRSDAVKKETKASNNGKDKNKELILKLANTGKNKLTNVVTLSKEQINAVLKSLNPESKYVDASTQFSPQQNTILASIKHTQIPPANDSVSVAATTSRNESVKRTLETTFPVENLSEADSKKLKLGPPGPNVIAAPVISPMIVVKSPDVEVRASDVIEFEQDEDVSLKSVDEVNSQILNPDLISFDVPNTEDEACMIDVTADAAQVPSQSLVASSDDSVICPDVIPTNKILRISPEFPDSSSQDAEVARINMPAIERARLVSKGRPSPLRVLHLEPEFCASPPLHQLPRLASKSPSPCLPHRVTERDLDLASPLLVPRQSEIVNLPSKDNNLQPEDLSTYTETKESLSAIPRSIQQEMQVVMPQPLSPSDFSISPRDSRCNSVFSFPSAVNTPDFDIMKFSQASLPSSPAIFEDGTTLAVPKISQVGPMIPVVAMTPKTIIPSSIQQQYSTPIQSLALANAMKMNFHSNITSAMTPAQTIGAPLAFTPISAIATPGTFFRSTPGYPVPLNLTPSEKLSEGLSATFVPGGGYVLPFRRDFIPVRKLSMPPRDASS